jgi:hypothetical protein
VFLVPTPGIRLKRTGYETILVIYLKGCYSFLPMTAHKRLAEALDAAPD